ncbi:MAG: hypothetical protein RL217_1546 [Pseudomonadota bacterium]|jgi:uracil-DNA glycosylase
MSKLIPLLQDIHTCRLCAAHLPFAPKPILQAGKRARILIIGQAPGIKAHNSGIPWSDASGERLRAWLGVTAAKFYDPNLFAIMPMGFCYPGCGKSGDLPPRPECAPKWHAALLKAIPEIKLTLLIGQYAQNYYLKDDHKNLTKRVEHWRDYLPKNIFVLPHPSPRNQIWLKRNPWFEQEAVPELQRMVRQITNGHATDAVL